MELLTRKLKSKTSLILIFAILVFSILFFSVNIKSPGLQYDETLFINGSLGFKFNWYTLSSSFLGIPFYVFPYIGALKSWIYIPIFKIFGITAASIRIPSLIFGVLALNIPLFFYHKNLSFLKIFIYISILLSCPNFYMLTRNDWGPVALNLIISSILFSLIFIENNISKVMINILIVSLSILLVFNKLDGVIIIFSTLFSYIFYFFLETILFYLNNDYKSIKINAQKVISKIYLFIPSLTFFLLRYFEIKKIMKNLPSAEGKTSIFSFIVNSTKSIFDPFTLDHYFYGVNQGRINFHYFLYIFIIISSCFSMLILNYLYRKNNLVNLSQNGNKLCFIGLINLILLFLIPNQTAMHHHYMAGFPLLLGSIINYFQISDLLNISKRRIIYFLAIIIFSSNLILNLNGSFFHWKQLNNGSYSKIWNNEIYEMANNYSKILSDKNSYISSIFTSWGYLNQVESLNVNKIQKLNYDSLQTSQKIKRNQVKNAYDRYLYKSINYPILRNHYLIFSGTNQPLKISEMLYSEINSKDSKNLEKDLLTKKQCLDLYPQEVLDLNDINGVKYIYNKASNVMKFSHTCVFKLDPS